MERLSNTQRETGLTCQGLRFCGLLLTLAGIIGRGLLQNHILGLGTMTTQQLLDAMEASSETMTMITVSLVFQLLETCAVPIFAWLLVKGAQHTADIRKYLLRVGGVALVSEIPYDLAMQDKWLDMTQQNPVLGLFFALVMLMFFREYAGKQPKNILIRLAVFAAAAIWTAMLKIDSGLCVILIVTALWLSRNKAMIQNLCGAAAAMVCSLVNIFFMFSPVIFLALHLCNGRKGESSRLVNYLAYPAMLVAVAICASCIM